MQKYKYLILGAGPSGLAFANCLKKNGENNFLVLEREETSGGLCRSKFIDGSYFDIGGGHFLDTRNQNVLDFLFSFMPKEEWNLYTRNSKISFQEQFIDHPFEANIWQMDIENQLKYLLSISNAGCLENVDMPDDFISWIYWKLGKEIANDYMIPYNKKMFGQDLNCLGTYWLSKLPNVSFEDTLRSCLLRKPFGQQPAHSQFYYPIKYGYGELWERMALEIQTNIRYKTKCKSIDFDRKVINNMFQGDIIINTVPWCEFEIMDGIAVEIQKNVDALKFSSVYTEYLSSELDTDAQWIYYPQEYIDYHRILVRKNFILNARGYWTETNATRYVISDKKSYFNQYAYPLNTKDKPEIMKQLLNFSESKGVFGLGRWGEWEHFNSDIVVDRAIKLANRVQKEIY